ncbi:MAG: type II secretion system F family protein [Elusimicrobia bacterium]|nr:type II secretion system F family protein [Candidatus Liberimonas magnetica]
MIFLFKIIIIISAGVGAAILTSIFMKLISNTSAKRIKPSAPKKTISISNELKKAFATLAENQNSKSSKKIRIIFALFIFLLFQMLLNKALFSFVTAGGAYILIGSYFARIIQKEKDKFENQLIDALGIITNSVKSGQSLLQALENMINESKPPIALEFSKAMQEIKLGIPIEKALLEITKRVKSKDFKIAITSINLAKETGGNLGEILTRLSDTMRERHKLQGKINALTAQGKASGLIIGCIPFLLLIILYFLEPGMFGLMFTTTLGNALLVMVIFMVSIGFVFINKIIKIDI